MKTILVVDDRPDSRYGTVKILAAAGYDVREAASGRSALGLARLPVDLVVLDVALVDMDGFQVCRQLREDPTTARIPVLMRTAVYTDEQHRRQGFAAGADEYLMDPIEPEVLCATVQRLLDGRPG